MTDSSREIAGTSDVATAAELGRRVADANYLRYVPNDDDGVILRIVRQDERLETVDLDSLRDCPRRARGRVDLTDPLDFVAYVKRLGSDSTTIWTDDEKFRLVAVFNDHTNAVIPGWRDHTAMCQLRTDPDFDAWLARNGRLMRQSEFAELLEDLAHTVHLPDAATMIELAQSFQARRNSAFRSGTRLDNGDIELAWQEETTATAGKAGRMEIPAEFNLKIVPFIGMAPVDVLARLRWRIREGELGIGYKLHRPDLATRAAFADVVNTVADAVDVPVLAGYAPSSVTTMPF